MESGHLADICPALEKAALKFHETHIWPQGRDAPTLETLVMTQGVYSTGENGKNCGSVDLIHIHKTAVMPLLNDSAKSIGVGSYLADYLLEQLKRGFGETEPYLIASAVYILQQAKLNIDGVGLNGKLVLFSPDGIQEFDQADINPFEKIMDEFNHVVASCFGKVVSNKESTKESMNAIADELVHIKRKYSDAISNIPRLRLENFNELSKLLRRLGA